MVNSVYNYRYLLNQLVLSLLSVTFTGVAGNSNYAVLSICSKYNVFYIHIQQSDSFSELLIN